MGSVEGPPHGQKSKEAGNTATSTGPRREQWIRGVQPAAATQSAHGDRPGKRSNPFDGLSIVLNYPPPCY